MTNQNKDYSWMTKIIEDTQANFGFGDRANRKIEAAIQSHIDEHYIGKGEAILNDDGEPLKVTVEVAGGINNIAVHVENPNSVADYRKAMDMIKNLFAGPKLYTESEVEQRCIESRLKLVEGAYIDQDVIYFRFPGGFADEYTMRQRLREQLSTNNKDTRKE